MCNMFNMFISWFFSFLTERTQKVKSILFNDPNSQFNTLKLCSDRQNTSLTTRLEAPKQGLAYMSRKREVTGSLSCYLWNRTTSVPIYWRNW